MIQINLTKTRGGPQVEGITFGEGSGSPSSTSSQDIVAVKKLFIIMSLSLGLYGYQVYNVSQLSDRRTVLSRQFNKLDQERIRKKKLADEAKILQKRIQDLENRIAIIKELSRTRLREIKALDALQTIIPEKVWFESIKYKDLALEIEGFAMEDEDLSLFVEAMEERPYFSNVVVKKSQDTKLEDGIVKQFSLDSSVEVAD